MKTRNLLRKIGGMLVAFAFIFSACEDDIITSELNLDDAYMGSLKIHLNAELNLQDPGLEAVPNGTTVVITGSNNSLVSSASGSWRLEVEAIDGIIQVDSIPVANSGSNITIYYPDFYYDQVQQHNDPEESVRKRYARNQDNTFILPTQTVTLSRDYTAYNDYVVPVKEVAVKIELEHYTRYRNWWGNYIQEVELNGTVSLYNNTAAQPWSKEVTATNGVIETTVPINQNFTIEYKTTIQHGDYETPGDDTTPWVTDETINYILRIYASGFAENQAPSYYERSYNSWAWNYIQWQ
jgi:hypothetical protein